PAKRRRGEQAIEKITDPRATGAIWAVFVASSVRNQMRAILMFDQIDGPSASNALATMAILNPSPEVRAKATDVLLARDPRDVVGRLVDLVHRPFKYEVRPVGGLGSPGALFVDGEKFNMERFYENQTVGFMLPRGRIYTPDVPFDPYSARNLML